MYVYRQAWKCSNVLPFPFKPPVNVLLLSSAFALWTLLVVIDITIMMLMTGKMMPVAVMVVVWCSSCGKRKIKHEPHPNRELHTAHLYARTPLSFHFWFPASNDDASHDNKTRLVRFHIRYECRWFEHRPKKRMKNKLINKDFFRMISLMYTGCFQERVVSTSEKSGPNGAPRIPYAHPTADGKKD